MGLASRAYCNEYLGICEPFAHLPATDRCFLSQLHALEFHHCGIIVGPAACGKTATVKALAYAVGVPTQSVLCSESVELAQVAAALKGAAASGTWCVTGWADIRLCHKVVHYLDTLWLQLVDRGNVCLECLHRPFILRQTAHPHAREGGRIIGECRVCFERLDRLRAEVLSATAQHLQTILHARAAAATSVMLQGASVPLHPSCAVLATLVATSAASMRRRLPTNLADLFRPCTLQQPDCKLLLHILLETAGVHL